MSLIEKIQNLPREKKVRLVWTVCVSVAVVLAGLWVLTSRIGKTGPADTSFFKNLGQSFKEVKDNWNK